MTNQKHIAIIGGGPAGLMAAEILASAKYKVTIYDKMPNPARKFLMAGRGGLNLTHSEPLENFINRYGAASNWIAPYIKNFTPTQLVAWCEGLGQETFVGSSGRVFPKAMKASPLLRAWLKRLSELGVEFALKHTWQGWQGEQLKFIDEHNKTILVNADATLLALGGKSWPKLGSDGGWVNFLTEKGVEVANFKPSNCGFLVNWSALFSDKFAGTPIKSVALTHAGKTINGEVMITAKGIEGGAIYALSAVLRDSIEKHGSAKLQIDLRPNMKAEQLAAKLGNAKSGSSLSTHLRKLGFAPVAISLLREVTPPEKLSKLTALELASALKSISIELVATTGLEKAISSAGGIKLGEVNQDLMLTKIPSVFVAGEMLDWEAPTGGYLLQGCFSTAHAAAGGVKGFLGVSTTQQR